MSIFVKIPLDRSQDFCREFAPKLLGLAVRYVGGSRRDNVFTYGKLVRIELFCVDLFGEIMVKTDMSDRWISAGDFDTDDMPRWPKYATYSTDKGADKSS